MTGTLTNSEIDILTNQTKAPTQENHVQLVVLVVDIAGDKTIGQYAARVPDSWKPGDKDRDNGVLLLVVWQNHTVRIEIGYGLEGIIMNAQSGKTICNSTTLVFKKGGLAGGLQKGTSDIGSRLTGNNSATITSTDHPLFFNGWWVLLVRAMILMLISARGYIKMLEVTCFVVVTLTFVLPIVGFSGSWGALTTLLCFAVPSLAVAIAFTLFSKKVRDSMRDANQPSCHTRNNPFSHYSSPLSSSFDNDDFSDGSSSSGGGGASGRW